jgi:hypothetical protein
MWSYLSILHASEGFMDFPKHLFNHITLQVNFPFDSIFLCSAIVQKCYNLDKIHNTLSKISLGTS